MDLHFTRDLSLNTFYSALFCTNSYNFHDDYSKGLGYVGKIEWTWPQNHTITTEQEPYLTNYQLHSSPIIQSSTDSSRGEE